MNEEPKLYVVEPVVSMSPTTFIIDGDRNKLKGLSNEVKCKWIKMLINHVGVADEEIKPQSFVSRYISTVLRRTVSSAKRTLVRWTTETRAWRAVKRLIWERRWGSYRF